MEISWVRGMNATVRRAASTLRSMPADRARERPGPGKWSPKEIIGHLIDSASNNHQRFVRARYREDLRFDGYDQDAWVRDQNYQAASWHELVTLWEAFNLHIARVIEETPAGIRERRRTDHNLDALAWEVVPRDEPVTLEYFMRDYVGHLHHHLRQIDPDLAEPPTLQRTS